MEIALAASAGVAARLICHPLDTIKTVRFTGFASVQGTSPGSRTSTSSNYGRIDGASSNSKIVRRRSIWFCARQIWKSEGVPGFYRGVGVTVFGAAPGVALYLSSYHYCHNWLSHHFFSTEEAEHIKEERKQEVKAAPTTSAMSSTRLGPWIAFTSGIFAEAVSCVVWVPIDVTKERLQSQPISLAGRYQNSRHALESIICLEGIKGLYRGYFSTLGSFGPFSGVYFVTYEYLCGFLSSRWSPSSFSLASNSITTSSSSVGGCGGLHRPSWIPLVSGFGATVVAGLCCNPLELVKTRLQVQRTILSTLSCSPRSGSDFGATSVMKRGLPSSTRLFSYQYKGLFDGIAQMIKNDGCLSLWRGTAARVAFQGPNAALTMTFYDFLLKHYGTEATK